MLLPVTHSFVEVGRKSAVAIHVLGMHTPYILVDRLHGFYIFMEKSKCWKSYGKCTAYYHTVMLDMHPLMADKNPGTGIRYVPFSVRLPRSGSGHSCQLIPNTETVECRWKCLCCAISDRVVIRFLDFPIFFGFPWISWFLLDFLDFHWCSWISWISWLFSDFSGFLWFL